MVLLSLRIARRRTCGKRTQNNVVSGLFFSNLRKRRSPGSPTKVAWAGEARQNIKIGTHYRNAFNRLAVKDRAELFAHLKEQLGMSDRPQGELIDLTIASAESWIDEWAERRP